MKGYKKILCFVFILTLILFLPNISFASDLSQKLVDIEDKSLNIHNNETNAQMDIIENISVSKEKSDDYLETETEFVEDLQTMSKTDISEEDVFEESEKEENIIEDSKKEQNFIEESEAENESKEEVKDEDIESSEGFAVIGFLQYDTEIRSKPNGDIIDIAKYGSLIKGIKESNGWIKLEDGNYLYDIGLLETIPVKGFVSVPSNVRKYPNGEIVGLKNKDSIISGHKETNGWIRLDDGNYIYDFGILENIEVKGFIPVSTNVRSKPNGEILRVESKNTLISGIKESNGWIKLEDGNYLYDFGLLDSIKVKGFIPVSTNVRTKPNGTILKAKEKESLVSGIKSANNWIRLEDGNFLYDFGLLETIRVKGFLPVSTNVRTAPNGKILRAEAMDSLISGYKNINGWINLDKGNYLYDFGLKSTIPVEGYVDSTINLREKPNGTILGVINAGMYVHGNLTSDNYVITVGPTNSGKKTVYLYNFGLYKKHHKGYTRMALNIRSGASLSSRVIGSLPYGTYINKFSDSDWIKYGNGYVNARTVVATVQNSFKNTKYLYTVDGKVPEVINGRKVTGEIVDPNKTTNLTKTQINERIRNLPYFLKDGTRSNPTAVNTLIKYKDYKGRSSSTNLDYDYQNALKSTRKVKVPYLAQFDERWGFEHMHGKNTDYIANIACGPTALTMVYSYFTGDTSLDVKDMTEVAIANGWSTGYTSYATMFYYGPKTFGLSSYAATKTVSNVKNELDKGRLLVALVSPGDFTSSGHFIILSEYIGNEVKIYDPADYSFTNRNWSIQRVLNQTIVMYSIGY